MRGLGSVASVLAVIRDDAAVEIDKLEKSAAEEIAQIRGEEAAAIEVPDRELRLAAAKRRNAERLAQQEWETRNETLRQREEWIARAVALGREALARTRDRQQLARLAREALQRLPGDSCEIAVSQADRALIDEMWCRDVAASCGKREVRIAAAPAPISGGCIVSSGQVAFDNSDEERSRRYEPYWRAALSEIYRPDAGGKGER